MARNGYPDDPDNYSEGEPTRYADYGGTGAEAYSEYGTPTGYVSPTEPVGNTGRYPAPVPAAVPWHQRPVVLVGFGVLTAAVLALLVYAVVKFTTAGNSERPAVTSTSPTTSSAPTTQSSTAEPSPGTETAAPSPSTTAEPPPPPPPTTVTTTVTPTTTAPPTTTAAPTPSTTTTISTTVTTSVTTVTETTTRPLFPNWPRPTRPTLLEPAPGG